MNPNDYEQKKNEIDRLFKSYKPIDFKSHLPAYLIAEIEAEELYTNFVLNYLIRRKNGIAKIDLLVLKMNGSKQSFYHFIKHMKAADYGYVKILKQNEKSITLQLTDLGISHYNYISKHFRVARPWIILRIILFLKKMIYKVYLFIIDDIPHYLKIFSESGITKTILFLIAFLTFILKWKEIKEFIHILTK